ncbi:hypothetical protein [Staphylococcus hyicus]|uniref:Uncharacterized protein n=1 Tax=Staphylococcus hyicus TaxID=1284 RepID=A0ACD5FPB2_STAHY|nr:hypothetical protein [Staphylococcus hyicus]MCQ9300273.1 hypothetical protein [Staphylococcus hyicus]MDP4449195.1 hypothetical protein [Staphylococcus hyicus]MDP4462973.1 hypothetical protein [Staphylococcus hyicus]
MSVEMMLFFIVAPLIIVFGNLVLAPKFQRHIPMRVHVTSCIIGLLLYTVGAALAYYFLLQGKI